MKKIALVLITIFCVSIISTNAQDMHWDASGGYKQMKFGTGMRGFYYGPIVGINTSTVTNTSYAEGRVRPIIGLMIGYQISNILGIQAEANYSWEGCNFTNSDMKYTLNYLKIPVLLKLNIIAGLGVEAGVSFEPLIYSDLKNGTQKQYDQFKGSLNNMDFTIPVGASFLIARRVEIGARYYIPLTKIFSNSEHLATNSVFSFTVKCRL